MNISLSYGATFILGMIHALEPGHGKTFIMAFSLQRSTIKAFISLLVSLFITHFLMLGAVAYALQFAASSETIEHWIHQIKWMIPLLVIGFGFYLLIKHIKSKREEQAHCCGHHHDHSNVKNATLTGILTGLLPCPTAIAPLLLSGLDGEFNSAIWHILVYVIGMTIALITFVLLVVVLKKVFRKQLESFTEKVNINLVSAVLIICIGSYYMIQVFSEGGVHPIEI